jgi:hypothetical protein
LSRGEDFARMGRQEGDQRELRGSDRDGRASDIQAFCL